MQPTTLISLYSVLIVAASLFGAASVFGLMCFTLELPIASVVIRAGRQLEVLAVNELDDPIDASPAIVGKQLFLRSADKLYCLQEE